MKKKKNKRIKHQIYRGVVIAFLCTFLFEGAVYAVTNKAGCNKSGSVTAVYEKGSQSANGYYQRSGNIIVTYDRGEDANVCSDVRADYVGLTNAIQRTSITSDEAQASGGGHICNGHTSEAAHWRHWFGLSGTTLYGLNKSNTKSISVTEDKYKKCSYVIAGPLRTFGDGLTESGKFEWAVSYQKLPDSAQLEKIDIEVPRLTLKAEHAGRTAVNKSTGIMYSTEALLTATSVDNEARPHKTETFLWEGPQVPSGWRAANAANAKSAKEVLQTKINGVYYVSAKDQLGNSVKSTGVEVRFLDYDPPEGSLSTKTNNGIYVNGKEWTANNVAICATASDRGCGLDEKAFCWDGTTWTNQKEYTVSRNGKYELMIQDALGNKEKINISVDNIDQDKPEVKLEKKADTSIIANEKEWTRTYTTLNIKAVDAKSGLQPDAYSFDGGRTWTKECSQSFEENGKIEVKVRDNVNNIETIPVEIKEIDKDAPVFLNITKTPEQWSKGVQSIEVAAEDYEGGCGLHDMAYSFDGGVTWTDKNTFESDIEQNITISVRDAVSNVAEYDYTFKKEKTPEITEEENKEEEEKEKEEEKKEEEKEIIEVEPDDKKPDEKKKKKKKKKPKVQDSSILFIVKDSIEETVENVIPNVQEKRNKKPVSQKANIKQVSENTVREKEGTIVTQKKNAVKVTEDENEPLPIKDRPKEKSNKSNIFIYIILLLFLLLLLALLYLFIIEFKGAVVYGMENKKWLRLGKVYIDKKEEQYVVEISDSLLDMVSGNDYKLVINRAFLSKHGDEDIFLLIKERMIKKKIQKNIEFKI